MNKVNHSILMIGLLVISVTTSAQDSLYCVDLEQPAFEHYDLLNQDMQGKKIIMLGEMHYKAANSILKADLLIHLNKHFGVRQLLMEFGRAEAYLYNSYLESGDEWYLKQTTFGFRGYQEFLTSWRRLYDYHRGLPEHKKIKVHGLDLEREPGLSASLYTLLAEYASDPEVESLRNSLKVRLDTIGVERDNHDFILELRERIPRLSLPPDENGQVIDAILNNESFLKRMDKRDSLMAEAFMALDTTDEAYFGQFGFAHTGLNAKNSLAGVLNNLEEYRDKIMVVNMYYIDTNKGNFPLQNLSDCPIFLYKIDPQDEQYGGFAKRGQWALILKDQPNYRTVENIEIDLSEVYE